MGSKAERVLKWLGFVSDLLSGEPLCDLPHDLVFDQLSTTFAVGGASYNWCEPGRPPGMITRPSGILDPLEDLLGPFRQRSCFSGTRWRAGTSPQRRSSQRLSNGCQRPSCR